MSTILDLRLVSRNQDRYENMILARPAEQRAVDYFKENIGKVTTVDQFMSDDKLYRFVMEAFDLGSQTQARGLIRKVLEEGVTDGNSTANRMNDSKFKELATVLGFAENDGANLQSDEVVQAIVDRYVTVKVEETSEDQNPAVRLGLYFQRKASSITNWYQVMADSALRKVVFTTLGLPDQTSLLDVDRQNDLLKKRMDIGDFQDPAKVSKFLDRFAAMYDMRNSTVTSGSTPSIAPITAGSRPSIISIDPSITVSLLNFPRF